MTDGSSFDNRPDVPETWTEEPSRTIFDVADDNCSKGVYQERLVASVMAQGLSRADALAALDAANGDGDAALLHAAMHQDGGGAAATARQYWTQKMIQLGVARADAEAALKHTNNHGSAALEWALNTSRSRRGAAVVAAELERLPFGHARRREAWQVKNATEAQSVLQIFSASFTAAFVPCVTKIVRIQSPRLFRRLSTHCHTSGFARPVAPGLYSFGTMMFHGTAAINARQIISEGFDIYKSRSRPLVWFAARSQKSMDYSVRKEHEYHITRTYTMFVALVGLPAHTADRVASGVEDVVTIGCNHAAYPSYLVEFQIQ